MDNEVFKQNLEGESIRPGGPVIIQMLFKGPVAMPGKEQMAAAMARHLGSVECICHDEKTAGFAALEHVAKFSDGTAPVQLMVMGCLDFEGSKFDSFSISQMWDCREERERILCECRYQVVAMDMLAAALPALERTKVDMDFLDALAELYPGCKAVYFQSCGKLFSMDDLRSFQGDGPDRFIRFGVNVRLFNIQGTKDMLVDTVGMSTLFLPDLQYHFHDMDSNLVVSHAYDLASYILKNDNSIQDGETVDGVRGGRMCPELQWSCRYERALIQPPREVLDVHMGEYASGSGRQVTL